ncbi:MAG: hypothetical protein PHR25_02350 [Clostridia bacterium]|nr:hypothetical protein [Clostridia bacterium]MDD4375601.1 hypothetical protein [Clostridia bacterium]
MKVKLCVQKEGQKSIKCELLKESNLKPKKVYFYIGNMKETGFEIFEECLIDLKARKLIVLGVDRKNTTKKMLETILRYTKNVYLFNNNNMIELDTHIMVFEHEKTAKIYVINGNVSEGGYIDNISTYTLITYDLSLKSDNDSYKEYIDELLNITKFEEARKLEKEYIKELFDKQQIFTNKQYTHNVMSISELLNEKETPIKKEKLSEDDVEIPEDKDWEDIQIIPEIDLSGLEEFNINIDVEDMIEKEQQLETGKENIIIKEKKEDKANIKKEDKAIDKTIEVDDIKTDFDENEVLDIEDILFETAAVGIDKRSIDKKIEKIEKEKSKEKPVSKKIDLAKVSNLILELPKKPSKGKDVGVIKVPNYIKEMIPDFFEALDKGTTSERVDGVFKEVNIKLEIVDVKGGKKVSDNKAKISSKAGQTYITFHSDELKNINYEEDDITRIIKLAQDTYHIEIISKEVQEYKIWKKLCSSKMRGSKRNYGIM